MPALGLDIGGQTTKAVLIADDGSLLRESLWLSAPDDGSTGDAAAWCATQVTGWLPERDALTAVGIAICGLIDPVAGTMVHAPNVRHLEHWPYRDTLVEALGVPVALLNDAKAFVYGEAQAGAARGQQFVLGLTLGTGIGGGLILDGRLYLGAHGWLGEIGHIPLDPEGPVCLCGLRGCLEAYIREEAFVRNYNASLTDPRVAVTSGGEIAERAALGDPDALVAWQHYGDRLGVAIAGAVTLLDVNTIVLGGGLACGFDFFCASLRASLEAGISRPDERGVRVVPAALGRHAGAIGAARYAASL